MILENHFLTSGFTASIVAETLLTMALMLINAVDVFVFKTNWSVTELFFLTLIGIGILGLRVYSAG